jgi:hypothetical protein
MTERVKGFYVSLERDIRVDDVEMLCNVVRSLRGVAGVTQEISNMEDWMARARVRNELRDKLYAVMFEFFDERKDNGGKNF